MQESSCSQACPASRRSWSKPLSAGLGLQVLEGPRGAGGRDAHLYGDFRIGRRVKLEPGGELAARHLREIVVLGELGVAALVIDGGLVLIAVFHDGAGEAHGKIGIVGAGPAVGDAVAHHEGGAQHLYLGPERLAVVVVDAVVQVQDNVALIGPLGVGVAVHAHARGCRQLHLDAAVFQPHLVVAGSGRFMLMAEALAVAFLRLLRRSGREQNLSRSGHQQDISQVGVAGPAEVRVGKTYDGRVFILVTGAVLVGAGLIDSLDVVGNHFRVGRQLHSAEGDAGSGEGMTHSGGADEGIHILCVLGLEAQAEAQGAGQ